MPSNLSRWILVGAALSASGCTEPQIVDSSEPEWLSPPEPAEFACKQLEARDDVEFCSDFDHEDWIDSWNGGIEIYPAGSGSVERSGDGARSQPAALVATIGGSYDDGVGYAGAFIRENLGAFKDRPFRARISFAMRVEAFDGHEAARISVLNFMFGDLEDLCMLTLNLESRGDRVVAQFTEFYSGDGLDSFRPGDFESIEGVESEAWHEVVVELDIEDPQGGGNRLKVTLDEKSLFDGELSDDLSGRTPRMQLGIPWVDTEQATEPWQVRFDNVLVEMRALD